MFLEHAEAYEKLPPTPKWLREEEDHWEEKITEKLRKAERKAELEALKGSTRWQECTNMEEELDRLERLRAQEVAARKADKRKTRTHTAVARPDRDEGDDEEIKYGVVRYYIRPEDIVLGGRAIEAPADAR